MNNNFKDAQPGRQVSAGGMRRQAQTVDMSRPPIVSTGSPIATFAGAGGAAQTFDSGDFLTGRGVGKITKRYIASILDPVHFGFKQQVQNASTGVWEDATTGLKIDGQTPPASYGLAAPGNDFSVGDMILFVRHPQDLNLWMLIPFSGSQQEFDAEITGVSSGLYSWKKKVYNSSGTLIDDPTGITGTSNLYRNISNTVASPGGPPDIPNGQVVRIKPLKDKAGFYETDAVGGLELVSWTFSRCVSNVSTDYTAKLTGRDLTLDVSSVSPPPSPPPPATGTYYCFAGNVIFAQDTPPDRFDCGPYDYKPDCAVVCPSPSPPTVGGMSIAMTGVSPPPPLAINDTATIPLSQVAGTGGPYNWYIAPDDPTRGEVTSSQTHTGSSFSPTVKVLDAGTVNFNITLTDDTTPANYANTVVSITVNPPQNGVYNSNTTIDSTEMQGVIQGDSSGGGITLTLGFPAASMGKGVWLAFKNIAGANNVTIVPDGSDTIDGGASLVLSPGTSCMLLSDNLSDWVSVGGP